MSMHDDITLLIKYLRSLPDFKYTKTDHPLPYGNMGATITEAILQAGIDFLNVVQPRVAVLLERSDTVTTDDFYDLLIQEGARSILSWDDTKKPKRIFRLTDFLSQEGIQTELELKTWMQDDGNIQKLISISGIGNKTVDYLRILTGISTTAVDRHILKFLKNAGINIDASEYGRARSIVNETSVKMGIDASSLDYSIWSYMSTKSGPQEATKSEEKKVSYEISRKKHETSTVEIGPYNMEKIFLCSADASPSSQKRESGQAQYFFPKAKWVGALRNTAKRLNCDFFIITTAHGMVTPTEIISPYDMHVNKYPVEVEAIWRRTMPEMLGAGRFKLMIFYAGGCPRDEMLTIMLPILLEHSIDLLTFGRPNMVDVNKIEDIFHMLVNGTSGSDLKSILKEPERFKFYPCK